MSEDPFSLPPVPLMRPERARYVARAYKALSENLATIEPGEAAKAERQSQRWLAYSIALATKPPAGDAT